jgi:hypothetical protein
MILLLKEKFLTVFQCDKIVRLCVLRPQSDTCDVFRNMKIHKKICIFLVYFQDDYPPRTCYLNIFFVLPQAIPC